MRIDSIDDHTDEQHGTHIREVTGLSQDRVSKQDAVAGKHKKQVV